MKIAITGTLNGYGKAKAEEMIAAAGAVMIKRVTKDTSYLVSAKIGTGQEADARRFGVPIITQQDFEEFLVAGGFPPRDIPLVPRPVPSKMPWISVPHDHRAVYDLCYADYPNEEISDRRIVVTAEAELPPLKGSSPRRYIQAVDLTDGRRTKTFLVDRVVSLKPAEDDVQDDGRLSTGPEQD